nr:MAG TPA: hypothetical protein [Caudoviricetes sp.]
MKLFLSCLYDRVAYEYMSKRKDFLIYADSVQKATQKTTTVQKTDAMVRCRRIRQRTRRHRRV